MRNNKNVQLVVNKIIQKILPKNSDLKVEPNSRFKEDLGLDSLSMAEITMEVESAFKIEIVNQLNNIRTVGELTRIIENSIINSCESEEKYRVNNYVNNRSVKDIKLLNFILKLMGKVWKIKVTGIEKININENYIFCPNHESHFDILWVLSAIGEERIDLSKICCLAKEEHLSKKITKRALELLGGIPVDRSGNTVPAFRKALEYLRLYKYNVFIHPEGTRTRDGMLKEFKKGAAKLAIESGVTVIPVKIKGAYEIYPPNRALPRIFNWRKWSRYSIEIYLCEPISPENKSSAELNELIRNEIENCC